MLIIDSPVAVVKPATFAPAVALVDADVREMGAGLLMDEWLDSMTDAELDQMAEESRFADRYEGGEMPW